MCDDYFTDKSAQVVCTMIGYPRYIRLSPGIGCIVIETNKVTASIRLNDKKLLIVLSAIENRIYITNNPSTSKQLDKNNVKHK